MLPPTLRLQVGGRWYRVCDAHTPIHIKIPHLAQLMAQKKTRFWRVFFCGTKLLDWLTTFFGLFNHKRHANIGRAAVGHYDFDGAAAFGGAVAEGCRKPINT